MQLTQMDKGLIRILYLCVAGIVLFQMLGYDTLISMLFTITFVLVAFLWIFLACRSVTKLDIVIILTICLTLFNVAINAWMTDTDFSFSYIKKSVIFAMTLLYFQAANKMKIDKGTEKFLLWMNSGIALILILYFFVDKTGAYWYNERVTQYLTFGFTNPNLTALFLLSIGMVELLHVFKDESQRSKLFHFILAAAMIWFVLETQSRTCVLVVAAEVVLFFWLYLKKKKFSVPNWLAAIIVILPLGFAYIYLLLIEVPAFLQLFSFMESAGKTLDTRVTIWQEAFDCFGQSPIFGAYSQISDGGGTSQMHNTHVDILASYGILVLILVCYILFCIISEKRENDDKYEAALTIGYAGTLIMGFGEAALFSGGMGIYLMAGLFLLLRNRE